MDWPSLLPSSPALAQWCVTLELAQYYRNIWLESKQAEFVLSLCPSIDAVKFATDHKYRHHSVMNLARSSDPANMQVALQLCHRYAVPLWDLYSERVQWLFERVNSTPALKDHVIEYEAELLVRPDQFAHVLRSKVYHTLDGTDFERLGYYFSLLDDCAQAAAKAKTPSGRVPSTYPLQQYYSNHQQLLSRLLKSHIALDYRRLIDPPTALHELYAAVTPENLRVLLLSTSAIAKLHVQRAQAESQSLSQSQLVRPPPSPLNVVSHALSDSAAQAAVSSSSVAPSPFAAELAAKQGGDGGENEWRLWLCQYLLSSLGVSSSAVVLMLLTRTLSAVAAEKGDIKAWMARFDKLFPKVALPHLATLVLCHVHPDLDISKALFRLWRVDSTASSDSKAGSGAKSTPAKSGQGKYGRTVNVDSDDDDVQSVVWWRLELLDRMLQLMSTRLQSDGAEVGSDAPSCSAESRVHLFNYLVGSHYFWSVIRSVSSTCCSCD